MSDQTIFVDKVALVTGASQGIGRATALELARRGACVAVAARRPDPLERVAAEIRSYGKGVLAAAVDVTDRFQLKDAVREVVERWGRVDILVASAGEYVRAGLDALTVEDLERAMAVNFYGAVYAILEVLPYMQQQRSGHIVAVTSMDGRVAQPKDAPYASSKFALTGFLDVVRQELNGTNIYVTNIMPGRVDTAMIEHLRFHWISAKISPETVARATIKAIEKRKLHVILPPQAALLYYAFVLSPRLSDFFSRLFHLEGWEN